MTRCFHKKHWDLLRGLLNLLPLMYLKPSHSQTVRTCKLKLPVFRAQRKCKRRSASVHGQGTLYPGPRKKLHGKGTINNKHTNGWTSRLLDPIGRVGQFGENPAYGGQWISWRVGIMFKEEPLLWQVFKLLQPGWILLCTLSKIVTI